MSITRRVAALCVALFALLASLPAQAQSALSQDNDSISVATGLTYQLIAPADNGRLMVEIQNNNTSTDNCWINVDGIVVAGRRLWAVQNFTNQISRFQLSRDLSRGVLEKVITSPQFAVPTTAARFGHRLAAVNAHFDTGDPPTSSTYEVVVVSA